MVDCTQCKDREEGGRECARGHGGEELDALGRNRSRRLVAHGLAVCSAVARPAPYLRASMGSEARTRLLSLSVVRWTARTCRLLYLPARHDGAARRGSAELRCES